MTTVTESLHPASLPPPVDVAPPPVVTAPVVRWSLPTRVLFRFCALYFSLYILATQMYWGIVGILPFRMPYLGANEALRGFATWIATSWWGFPQPLSTNGGSGDKPFDYALACVLLIVSAAGTLIWSVVARRRESHPGVQKWFRLWLRFGLATTMVSYGMIKAFPVQMSYPILTRLLEPYGHFSLMGVLWAQIGASPAYQTFTGCAELLVAVLLFIPGLTTIAAIVGLGVTSQVFVLNMTYDVPVKLFSLHLMVMCLVLLAPDMRRLVNFFVLKRAAEPPSERPLARSVWGRRLAVAAQLMFAAIVLWNSYTGVRGMYYQRSAPTAPKPPLYGIWTIDRMTIDGVERLPLVTDHDRWRRLVVQAPTAITFQRMDDTFTGYGATVDMEAKTIALTYAGKPAGTLTIDHATPDRLVLDGDVQARKVRMETTLYDRANFRLVNSRFRWFQDIPFNR